ncbi:MAG: SAM-dependent methyltransferase, partial [Pseudomonadota bacterium]
MQQNNLTDIIKGHIHQHGPMTVETYWNLCLAHPTHGYYLKKDPLGVDGDFTTAPEISQLFGEMVGVWVAMQLSRLANPQKVHLVEFGPGRGTLMADILRTIGMMPVPLNSLYIHLVETSPALRAKQAQLLSSYNVLWHNDISTVPDDAPVLIIGNEFLDAL